MPYFAVEFVWVRREYDSARQAFVAGKFEGVPAETKAEAKARVEMYLTWFSGNGPAAKIVNVMEM